MSRRSPPCYRGGVALTGEVSVVGAKAREVRAVSTFSFLDVSIQGLAHIRVTLPRLLAVVAFPEPGQEQWRIHFALRGGATWTVYDDEELWRSVVHALGKRLGGGFSRVGAALVWTEAGKFLGFTSWGDKSEGRWYIEYALEGPEYARVPFASRAAWVDALRSLGGEMGAVPDTEAV